MTNLSWSLWMITGNWRERRGSLNPDSVHFHNKWQLRHLLMREHVFIIKTVMWSISRTSKCSTVWTLRHNKNRLAKVKAEPTCVLDTLSPKAENIKNRIHNNVILINVILGVVTRKYKKKNLPFFYLKMLHLVKQGSTIIWNMDIAVLSTICRAKATAHV